MKATKKILALILAAACLASCMTMSAFALDPQPFEIHITVAPPTPGSTQNTTASVSDPFGNGKFISIQEMAELYTTIEEYTWYIENEPKTAEELATSKANYLTDLYNDVKGETSKAVADALMTKGYVWAEFDTANPEHPALPVADDFVAGKTYSFICLACCSYYLKYTDMHREFYEAKKEYNDYESWPEFQDMMAAQGNLLDLEQNEASSEAIAAAQESCRLAEVAYNARLQLVQGKIEQLQKDFIALGDQVNDRPVQYFINDARVAEDYEDYAPYLFHKEFSIRLTNIIDINFAEAKAGKVQPDFVTVSDTLGKARALSYNDLIELFCNFIEAESRLSGSNPTAQEIESIKTAIYNQNYTPLVETYGSSVATAFKENAYVVALRNDDGTLTVVDKLEGGKNYVCLTYVLSSYYYTIYYNTWKYWQLSEQYNHQEDLPEYIALTAADEEYGRIAKSDSSTPEEVSAAFAKLESARAAFSTKIEKLSEEMTELMDELRSMDEVSKNMDLDYRIDGTSTDYNEPEPHVFSKEFTIKENFIQRIFRLIREFFASIFAPKKR